MTSNHKSVLLRMDPAEYETLKTAASIAGVSVNSLANTAISTYLSAAGTGEQSFDVMNNARASYAGSLLRSVAAVSPSPKAIADPVAREAIQALAQPKTPPAPRTKRTASKPRKTQKEA